MRIAPASILLDMSGDYTGYRQHREKSWSGYLDGDAWGAIPFAASHLFRGQTSRHVPMLPSIARGLDTTDLAQIWRGSVCDQAKVVVRLAQSWWFARELARHPISAHAKNQRLDLDEIALAQHYGLATGYFDLTDDFNVAGFFATCRWTPSGWEPMETGVGVVYRVDLRATQEPDLFGKYKPLGPQLLPRPAEQCAWVTELPLCHAFEGWPGVSMMQFHHDRRVAEHFLIMFNGGEHLFPADPLADVAAEILECNELPVDLADGALDSFASDPHGIRAEQIASVRSTISELVSLTNGRELLSSTQVSSLVNDATWRSHMLANVKSNWRAVRRIPVQAAHANQRGDPG